MPRSASDLAVAAGLLGALTMLAGCNGSVDFFTDTHSPTLHVNRPFGNSENARIVAGQSVGIDPLKTESGNVWPGPIEPVPTLEDLQKMPPKPLPDMTGITPPPLAVTPGIVIPELPHHLQPRPGEDGAALNGPLLPAGPVPGVASPQGPIVSTPQGNAVNTHNPNGLGQANPANPGDKSLGITVPNGNGTSTVIAPDGTITTIPTPP
jgi:hypothetical protein